MTDTKDVFHKNAVTFYEHADETEQDKERIERAQNRESRYNDAWSKVDIEEVRKRYAPKDAQGHKSGYKWVYEDNPKDHNHGYQVVCDMLNGSLRVYLKIPHTKKSKIKHKAVHIEDNSFGDKTNTHYKIKKRNGNDTRRGILKTLENRRRKRIKPKTNGVDNNPPTNGSKQRASDTKHSNKN
ncbi:hypothetical protein [Pseudoscardovia radai]|uniref:hypothetical protein n=1 Tax=Pseudoscardovia radai TaxID=987066 RepID=UPI003991ECCD